MANADSKESPLQNIEELLEQLGDLIPSSHRSMVLRTVEPHEVVNDALEEIELPVEEGETKIEEAALPDEHEATSFRDFETAKPLSVIAIDSGIIRLGETEDGLFIAIRGAIVIDTEVQSEVYLYRTGPMFLPYEHKATLLHLIGKDLLKPSLFVEIDDSDPSKPHPSLAKRGAADNAHQYGDRFRNWFERMLQLIAVGMIQDGIIILDGALTLRTRDTPSQFVQYLAQRASDNGNALIAISKQSGLQVQNKTIQFWLDDHLNRPGYKWLTPLILRERGERILGNLYAVRFTPAGPTFRMDIKAVRGQTDEEPINALYNSCLMRAGFPDILARAHAFSYFIAPSIFQLQAMIRADHRVIPRLEVNLAPILAPFGGRYR